MRPLFCRDSLLALVSTDDGGVVQEFGTGGGRLEPRRVLLSGLKNFIELLLHRDIFWCIVNDSLLAAWGIEDESPLTLNNIR